MNQTPLQEICFAKVNGQHSDGVHNRSNIATKQHAHCVSWYQSYADLGLHQRRIARLTKGARDLLWPTAGTQKHWMIDTQSAQSFPGLASYGKPSVIK